MRFELAYSADKGLSTLVTECALDPDQCLQLRHLMRIALIRIQSGFINPPTEVVSIRIEVDRYLVSRQCRAYVRTTYVLIILALEATKKTHPEKQQKQLSTLEKAIACTVTRM